MNICYYPHRDLSRLYTWNTTFLALMHDQLNVNSSGDDQGYQKIGRFNAAVWPLSPCQRNISIILVFWCYPLTFCLLLVYLNSSVKQCNKTLTDQGKALILVNK